MSPQIARQVVGFFHGHPARDGFETMSEREREVLGLLAEGSMYRRSRIGWASAWIPFGRMCGRFA